VPRRWQWLDKGFCCWRQRLTWKQQQSCPQSGTRKLGNQKLGTKTTHPPQSVACCAVALFPRPVIDINQMFIYYIMGLLNYQEVLVMWGVLALIGLVVVIVVIIRLI
jgi:hypothetical protein